MAPPRKIDRNLVYKMRLAGKGAKEIATACGVSRQAIYYILRGMETVPVTITTDNNTVVVNSNSPSEAASVVVAALQNSGWNVEEPDAPVTEINVSVFPV